MAHFNVSIFCSLQGPVQGPPRQKRSQDPLSLLCHGHGITYNNLYDMTEEARRRRMCATRWKFGQGRKREKTLKGRGNSKHVKSRSTADAGFFFFFFYDPPSEVVWSRHPTARRHPPTSLRCWGSVSGQKAARRTLHRQTRQRWRTLESEDYLHFNSSQTLLVIDLRWVTGE